MNITPFTIYIWQEADSLCRSAGFLSFCICAVAAIFTLAVCLIPSHEWEDASRSKARHLALIAWLIGVPIASFAIFMPSSKTIAMMAVIPELAHSKVIQQDLPDIYEAALKALKSQLSPEKK